MRNTPLAGPPVPGTRPGTERGPRTASAAHRDHGHGDRHEGTAGDPFAGLPGGSCQVPSQGEISSLIAVTAAANLALATRRDTDRRRAGHQAGTADPRSH
ncbi:hypothetical protein ACF1GW_14485 [Streptomyces achromogenes]|uniref:hypothetical protein n=1 Tax=Streptomyces achromogenes TaxID=67255 RepID=UPI0036FFC784